MIWSGQDRLPQLHIIRRVSKNHVNGCIIQLAHGINAITAHHHILPGFDHFDHPFL
jgi:hypothetical protein